MDLQLTIGVVGSISPSTQSFLTGLVTTFISHKPQWAIDMSAQLDQMEVKLSALTDQLTAVKNELDAVKSDLATVSTGVSGLKDQITTLNQSIADLKTQLANATIPPEAQAILDSITTEGKDVQASADSLAAQFPPAPPPPAV